MVDKVKIVKRIVGERYFDDDISVDRSKCVGIKHRDAKCRKCIEVCPTGALAIEKREILIDATSCINCGACVTACPTQALFSNWLPWKDLLSAASKSLDATHGHPVIACAKALGELEGMDDYDHDKVVELQCLERVDEGLLMALIASGARDIRFVCDDCVECDDGCMGAVWTVVVDDVRRMTRAVGCDFPLTVLHQMPDDVMHIEHTTLANKTLSRRDLFSSLKDEAKNAANVAFEETLADSRYGTVASFFGIYANGETALESASRGKICEWALGSLALTYMSGDGSAESAIENLGDATVNSRIFANIYIDGGKCQNCFRCVAYCKSSAIRKYMEEHRVAGFLTTPGKCTQCGICADLCRPKAIRIDDEVRVSDLLQERNYAATYKEWDEQRAERKRARQQAMEADEGAAERRARKRREAARKKAAEESAAGADAAVGAQSEPGVSE